MQAYIKESIAVKERLLNDEVLLSEISRVIEVIKDVYKKGGKLLIAGNGYL